MMMKYKGFRWQQTYLFWHLDLHVGECGYAGQGQKYEFVGNLLKRLVHPDLMQIKAEYLLARAFGGCVSEYN